VEEGKVFYDTGDEIFEQLDKLGLGWNANEALLCRQLETGVERIDFVSGDIDAILKEFAGIADEDVPYRVRELRWLIENAGDFDYSRVGNGWELSSLP
jgi:hypothetical protein